MYIQISKLKNSDVQKLKKRNKKQKLFAGIKNGEITRIVVQIPIEFEDLVEELEVILNEI